jgi:hypothetical protein
MVIREQGVAKDMRNEEIRYMNSLQNIIQVITSRRMRW